jgi:NTP pyrophosphatase (non-canonical NTP hydrolase)
MNFNEYQEKCAYSDVGTSAQDCINPGWLYYVLGIGDEAGELLGKIKKLFRDHNGVITDEFKKDLIKEMGDYHWYSARLCSAFGIDYNEVAIQNLKKLKKRVENGTIHGNGDNR